MGFEGLSQGKNSVLFGSDSDGVLYEKLSNTIHVGSRERLEGLQEKVECFSYEPTFEGDSLKQGATKNIGGLVLGVTERCNLRCSYCIYSGNYENERGHGSEDMDFDIARRAVAFARDQSGIMWKEAKERGDDAYLELYTLTVMCRRLLDHTLS